MYSNRTSQIGNVGDGLPTKRSKSVDRGDSSHSSIKYQLFDNSNPNPPGTHQVKTVKNITVDTGYVPISFGVITPRLDSWLKRQTVTERRHGDLKAQLILSGHAAKSTVSHHEHVTKRFLSQLIKYL